MNLDIPAWVEWSAVAAIALALIWRSVRKSEEPVRLVVKWVATVVIAAAVVFYAVKVVGFGARGSYLGNFGAAALLAGGIAVGGILIGVIWATTFGEMLATPLTALFDEGSAEVKPAPLYSPAIARRRQGRPTEALAEVDAQLTRFPGDFDGLLLRAEIQAVDLEDLSGAEDTLETCLRSSAYDPGQKAVVHTKLADWHMHATHDFQAARDHLSSILQILPGSEAALLAEQRLAHLGYEVQPKNEPIRVESGAGHPVATGVPPTVQRPDPNSEVPALLEHLKSHPHDTAARESLVSIYAWENHQPTPARTQLETLVALRKDSPRTAARYLNLLADIEIQLARDEPAARAALQRIIDRYPGSAPACQAENRLRFLSREMARHHVVAPKALRPVSEDRPQR